MNKTGWNKAKTFLSILGIVMMLIAVVEFFVPFVMGEISGFVKGIDTLGVSTFGIYEEGISLIGFAVVYAQLGGIYVVMTIIVAIFALFALIGLIAALCRKPVFP